MGVAETSDFMSHTLPPSNSESTRHDFGPVVGRFRGISHLHRVGIHGVGYEPSTLTPEDTYYPDASAGVVSCVHVLRLLNTLFSATCRAHHVPSPYGGVIRNL